MGGGRWAVFHDWSAGGRETFALLPFHPFQWQAVLRPASNTRHRLICLAGEFSPPSPSSTLAAATPRPSASSCRKQIETGRRHVHGGLCLSWATAHHQLNLYSLEQLRICLGGRWGRGGGNSKLGKCPERT